MVNRQDAASVEHGISILAGNSRVDSDDNGTIIVEAQLAAFRTALIRAEEIRSATDSLPSISIAFDHKGIFRKQFLAEGLTNSQKRNPRLSQLRQEIIDAFQVVTAEIGIPLSAIAVIHEDSARTHASHIIQTGDLPRMLTKFMKVDQDNLDYDEDAPAAQTCAIGSRDVDRVTCAAVTSEYFSSSVAKDAKILEVFFENDPWSQASVYTRGALLMRELGSPVDVRLRLVDKMGRMLGGQKPAL